LFEELLMAATIMQREAFGPIAAGVAAFLSGLAASASTQNQALAAILFLYRVVLQQRVGWIESVGRGSGRGGCRAC